MKMSKRKIPTIKVKQMYPVCGDEIFRKWAIDKKKILSTLPSSEGDEKILIKVMSDDYCAGRCLTETKLVTKEQLCPGCEMLSRFISHPVIDDDGIIDLKTENYRGRKLLRKFDRCESLEYEYNETATELNNHILSRIDKACDQESRNPEHHYFTRHGILNYAMISIIMDKLAQTKNFPHTTPMMWFYGCDRKLSTIEKVSNLGTDSFQEFCDLSETDDHASPMAKRKKTKIINEDSIRNIVCQLTTILSFFSNFQFSHASPTLEHLIINEKTVDYNYKGKKIYSPYTLSINPSKYSSITYGNSRFYYTGERNVIHDVPVKLSCFITSTPTNVSCDVDWCEEYRETRAVSFKPQEGYLEMLREEGIPIFSNSMNFVCFMVSMLCKDKFYTSFMKTDIETLWRSCWKYNEYSKLMDDIQALHHVPKVEFQDIYSVISKYNIRTDILDVFVEHL